MIFPHFSSSLEICISSQSGHRFGALNIRLPGERFPTPHTVQSDRGLHWVSVSRCRDSSLRVTSWSLKYFVCFLFNFFSARKPVDPADYVRLWMEGPFKAEFE